MIKKLDHVGIAVADIEAVRQVYEVAMGLSCSGTEVVLGEKVKTAFFPVGETNLELLESTEPEGAIGKFIASRGPGVHHLAFRVDDIEAAVAHATQHGLQVLGQVRTGAHGKKIIFCHPKTTGGVLIEFCQVSE